MELWHGSCGAIRQDGSHDNEEAKYHSDAGGLPWPNHRVIVFDPKQDNLWRRSESRYGTPAARSPRVSNELWHQPGTFVTAFPYWHQLGVPPETPETTLVSLALHQLDLLFAQQTAPAETAAIVIEPVLGEGGYVPAPTSFLSALRAICDQHGVVLIFDEVQSGFGRCGRYFACEWSGVKPDVMVFAKGLANRFPLSGVVSSQRRMDMMPPGTMGGTYAGNAVSCAAAIACTEVMEVSEFGCWSHEP